METITDTTQQFTEDDLARMLVEFEKHVNLYVWVTERILEAADSDDDDKIGFIGHLADHANEEAMSIHRQANLIKLIATKLNTDGSDWCDEDADKELWNDPHTRFAESHDRLHAASRAVTQRLMRMSMELDEMKTMEDFANGKEL